MLWLKTSVSRFPTLSSSLWWLYWSSHWTDSWSSGLFIHHVCVSVLPIKPESWFGLGHLYGHSVQDASEFFFSPAVGNCLWMQHILEMGTILIFHQVCIIFVPYSVPGGHFHPVVYIYLGFSDDLTTHLSVSLTLRVIIHSFFST